ncbi:MAG: 16S rRNA (cytidine(1402)-2'-O)-methyltransferase [Gemmatimonadetes bacterium]|nr:16S rRNA (cytidine(1402)-2'-O)-methyltransferase [Gemmatimonadota bacterium]
MGTLFVVSTPIGNLADMTGRGADVLASADRIVAEDTRRARTLLSHLAIPTRPVSLQAHNEARRTRQVLEWLSEGLDVALVSDAGTPLLSDPGERAVSSALDAGHSVVPIPGASAILAGLVASGLPCSSFTFHGFPPRQGRKRNKVLERVTSSPETSVLFESPARLGRLLDDLQSLGGGERRIAVCRELTKMHEEVVRGTVSEVIQVFETRPPRGEVTVVVEGGAAPGQKDGGVDLDALAQAAIEAGLPPSAAAKRVARDSGVPRRAAYEAVLGVSQKRKDRNASREEE